MPGISSLNTAISGMHAQRKVLDTTAHNIANQTTPGYHRQRVILEAAGVGAAAGVFSGPGAALRGVEATEVQRIVDHFAEARASREGAAYAGTRTLAANLARVEGVFREPGEDGLAAQLDEFWAGWSDVSNHPDDLAVRSQLLDRGAGLVDALHRASTELTAVEQNARVQIEQLAVDVTDLAARIADLNKSIAASGGTANDLLDQRDLLVKDMAAMTGAVTRPSTAGMVDVYIGGRAIVSGITSRVIDGTGGVARWATDGASVDAGPSELAALSQTIGDVVPRHRAALDGVAASLVTEVNALHSTGYDLTGSTGLDFFDPANLTAASISLSTDVAGQPDRVAAGAPVLPGPVAPGPFDGELARSIAAIAERVAGPDNDYRSLISSLGIEVRDAQRQERVQAQIAVAAATEADSVGGVSLDEELANLMTAQRAYEANARVMTVVDDLLGTLIERTGVVGR